MESLLKLPRSFGLPHISILITLKFPRHNTKEKGIKENYVSEICKFFIKTIMYVGIKINLMLNVWDGHTGDLRTWTVLKL